MGSYIFPQNKKELKDYLAGFDLDDDNDLKSKSPEIVDNVRRIFSSCISRDIGTSIDGFYLLSVNPLLEAYKKKDFDAFATAIDLLILAIESEPILYSDIEKEIFAERIKDDPKKINNGLKKSKSLEEKIKVREEKDKLQKCSFSPEKAREIRLGLSISQEQLGKEMDTLQANISRYELGRFNFKRLGQKGRKYLVWLKSNGYNPFSI